MLVGSASESVSESHSRWHSRYGRHCGYKAPSADLISCWQQPTSVGAGLKPAPLAITVSCAGLNPHMSRILPGFLHTLSFRNSPISPAVNRDLRGAGPTCYSSSSVAAACVRINLYVGYSDAVRHATPVRTKAFPKTHGSTNISIDHPKERKLIA